MAVTKVQNISNGAVASTTNAKAFASAVTAGNLIIVGCNWLTDSRTASCADSLGNTYANALAKNSVTGVAIQIFYAKNIAGGANTVTVTFSGETTSVIQLVEIAGASISDPLDQANAATSTGTSQDSGNITTTVNDEYLFGLTAGASSSAGYTKGAAFTELNKSNAFINQYQILTSTATESSNTTSTNSITYEAGIVSFKGIASTALTGTVTASITEADIVAGGKTIILTLTNDTWIAAGALSFDAQRQNIINGITSAQGETFGWNLVPKALQGVAGVVRTSDTVVTITLDAFATYNITATETITATIPATALVRGVALVASPIFTVSAVATSAVKTLASLGVG